MAFTRQNLTVYEKDDKDWQKTARRGAYIVKNGGDAPDITVFATGSEVNMALEAAKLVPGKKIRVVSVLDKNLFESQDEAFQKSICGGAKRTVVAEAGVRFGWEGYAKKEDLFTINRFGESGPANKVAADLGFTAAKLAELLAK